MRQTINNRLNSEEVCDVLSTREKPFRYGTLNNWLQSRIIIPQGGKPGSGYDRTFSLMDTVAFAMARGLKSRGFSLEAAANVCKVLMSFDEADVRQNFQDGRTCLVMMDDQVLPRLSTEDGARTAIEDFYAANDGTIDLHPIALDVKRLFDNIENRVDQIRSRKAESV